MTINAGSSSLKASLFDLADGDMRLALRGHVEGVGVAPRFVTRDPAGAILDQRTWPDADTSFDILLEAVLQWAEAGLGDKALQAVGHRVVHGGSIYVRPEPVTPALLEALATLNPLAPLHQPHNLAPIRAIAAARPGLPQVACFDTAFHATMPAVARRFALPRAYEEAGVRRYGFHGLSYEYIARQLAARRPDLAAGRVIVAHLGAGASLCALAAGRSQDTTMGFTAVDGLVMATRCGTLDPGVVLYLQRQGGLSAAEVERLLYSRSGMLGVSGLSGDMRTLLASAEPAAREAVDLFVYRIVREMGALASSLGGLDGVVFTAGIGERSAYIRTQVCAGLAWLGVRLDEAANAADAEVISDAASPVTVAVIPTDEESIIARHALEALRLV